MKIQMWIYNSNFSCFAGSSVLPKISTVFLFAIFLLAGFPEAIAQGAWAKKSDFGGSVIYLAAGFSIGVKGYIGTGYDFYHQESSKEFWEWDASANVWRQRADFAGAARCAAVGFSIGGKGYIGTGVNEDHLTYVFKDLWEWDPVTNVWTRKADFGGAERYYAAGFSIGTKGYIGTGMDSSYNFYKDFWEYDPGLDAWAKKANFGGGVSGAGCGFSIGTKGYIGTGFDLNTSDCSRQFWEWDPATNVWTKKADFAGSGRYWASGFSIGTKGYIGTGTDTSGNLYRDFWEWNPGTDTWRQKTDFEGKARFATVGFSIGPHGYLGVGMDTTFLYLNEFWEFDPNGTGIREIDLSNLISVYPNPSNGRVNVTINKFENLPQKYLSEKIRNLSIYNVRGDKVVEYPNRLTGIAATQQIDLSGQPNGVYFVCIRTEQGTVAQRIVIQK